MPTVQVKEISSRLGNFCLIRIGKTLLLTPCDTRMKIIQALARQDMTADELSRAVEAAYSTVMDHMDVLERAGVVTSLLKRHEGKRRIYFRLNEEPARHMQEIFTR